MTEQLSTEGGLSADDQAYFDTRGGEDLPDTGKLEPEAPEPSEDEVEVEANDEAVDPAQADEVRNRQVPHQALTSERTRRKAAEQKLNEATQTLARFDERLKMLSQPAPQPQEQAKPIEIPDPDQDPVGYMKVLGQALGVMAEKDQQTEQQRQHERVEREVTTRYAQDAQRFSAETPDFKEAYQFLGAQRAQELFIASGKRATAEQIRDQLHREERSLAFQAMRSGMSPAEAVYEMAKARGYQARQAQAPEEQAEESIDRTARAQNANRSLSSAAGGGSAGGPMTMDKFLSMSDAQARAYMTKNPEAFRRLQNGQR